MNKYGDKFNVLGVSVINECNILVYTTNTRISEHIDEPSNVFYMYVNQYNNWTIIYSYIGNLRLNFSNMPTLLVCDPVLYSKRETVMYISEFNKYKDGHDGVKRYGNIFNGLIDITCEQYAFSSSIKDVKVNMGNVLDTHEKLMAAKDITLGHVQLLKDIRPDMLSFLPAYAQLFLV